MDQNIYTRSTYELSEQVCVYVHPEGEMDQSYMGRTIWVPRGRE